MFALEVLVPEPGSILGVRIGMDEQAVRALFGQLVLINETEEPEGTCGAWSTDLLDGPGQLTVRFVRGRVRDVYWSVALDEKEVSALSKVLRAHLKRIYGVAPAGADKVYRSTTPVQHFAWTTKWGFDPTNFKLEMFPGHGSD